MPVWRALKARVPHRYKYRFNSTLSLLRTGRPFTHDRWTIGIYDGPSPLELTPSLDEPVLTPEQVSDVKAAFVADPFMISRDGLTHMFFEVWNRREGKGEIAHAVSRDHRDWDYQGVVLSEPYHLSYPYVFSWEGEHYLVPETHVDRSVRLYRALSFPSRWSHVATLLEGHVYKDASVFRHDQRWWMFTETSPGPTCDTLRLYSAEDLLGPWDEHPCSPVVEGDARIARPAGRVLVHDGAIIRYAQDCDDEYGRFVRAFRVTTLTTSDYREEPVGEDAVLGPAGAGWNGQGMHHVDAHLQPDGRWLACVDGR